MRAPVKELGGEIAEDFLSPKTAAYLQIGLFKAQAFQEQHQAGHPPVGGSPQMRERLAPKLLAGLEGGNGIGFFRGKPNIVPTQGTHLPRRAQDDHVDSSRDGGKACISVPHRYEFTASQCLVAEVSDLSMSRHPGRFLAGVQ